MPSLKALIGLCGLLMTSLVTASEPAAVYDGGINENATISLKIANGGAGQSGLVKALSDAFIMDRIDNGSEPFRVAWYKSDTTFTIKYLEDATVDVGITYSPTAEKAAIDKGIATSSYYAFRDHFLLSGPISNPANISKSADILSIFSALYNAAEGADTEPPVRFLSRFDKSATNIKESDLWISIGQVPWATPYSTWYHQYMAFPIQALTAAIRLEEYTITDRGTLLSLPVDLQKKMTIYKASSDDEDDLLLNPAHLLIGRKAENSKIAKEFVDWVVSDCGQSVIKGFKKNGEQLYSPAP